MIIRARAPLRLGLAGGGTDVSPYCEQFGGCVLNATIDRYAYAVIKSLDEATIRINASDQKLTGEYPLSARLALDNHLNLHKAVYNEIIEKYNNNQPLAIELHTFCDAPAGSGLGASSTLVVAIIKAFVELLNLPLDDYAIAALAFTIERVICDLPGGRQDQYSATFGGFNFMEFFANDRAIINPLRVKNWIMCELEASLILYFTGVSRASAHIIADQSAQMKSARPGSLEPFHGLKREAQEMKECLLKGDFAGMVASMRSGWEAKKNSAASVANPLINEIFALAQQAGALAGKVSGAGGGGFMMFFVPTEARMAVVRALQGFGGQVSNAHFTPHGAQAWKIL